MVYQPYQPRPVPPSALAPVATPVPAPEELPLPIEPANVKPNMPPKPATRAGKPRLRAKKIGLDTISMRDFAPDIAQVCRHALGENYDERSGTK